MFKRKNGCIKVASRTLGSFAPRLVPFLFLMFVFSLYNNVFSQVAEGWDVSSNYTLEYIIYKDMAHDSIQYTEFDTLSLTAVIGGGEVNFSLSSVFDDTTEYTGPFTFSEDGRFTNIFADSLPPPMQAELLFHIFPVPPFDAGITTWAVFDPPDAQIALENDALSIQQRTNFELIGERIVGQDTVMDFSVRSYLRFVDDDYAEETFGPDSLRSPDIQQVISDLSQFNLFLVGNLTWNVNARRTIYAEFTYVGIPHSGGTPESISNSWRRQHIIAELEVMP